jgi:hypothetical protein
MKLNHSFGGLERILRRPRARIVPNLHNFTRSGCVSDSASMRQAAFQLESAGTGPIPWAIQMRAVSLEEPGRLVKALTEAIVRCGGWVLARSTNDSGGVSVLFEFERRACVDIYGALVAAGTDLCQSSHLRFTEFCQCTLHDLNDCGTDVASIDLEIQTFPAERGSSGAAHQLD